MKKYTLLSLTLSSLLFAGGDIAPVVEPTTLPDTPQVVTNSTNYYLGLGYTDLTANVDDEATGSALTLMAGYKFYNYLAAEARYTRTIGSSMDVTGVGSKERLVSNKALYLKPQYTFADTLSVYGLLGYGETIARGTSGSGFQWGAGAEYRIAENIGLFADYTSMYDDTLDSVTTIAGYNIDSQVTSINVGLTYHF